MNSNPQDSTNDSTALNEMLSEIPEYININSDQELIDFDKEYLSNHNNLYSNLLEVYVKNAELSLLNKRRFKSIFFYTCIILISLTFVALIAAIIVSLFKRNSPQIIVTLLTTGASFIASFIAIPNIIAEYLFNTSDESNFTDIIKNMQDYDKSVRDHFFQDN